MQKKKRFDTRKAETWNYIYRLGYLLPVLAFAYLFIGTSGLETVANSMFVDGNPFAALVVIVLCAALAVILSIPLLLIWRAVFKSMRKSAISNATFSAGEGIDYYREKLEGLTPVDISLLMDLEIEPQKDVAALILSYVKAGLVTFEGDRICVLATDHSSLPQSDAILLGNLARNDLSAPALQQWQAAAYRESMQKGILEQKGSQVTNRSRMQGCLGGCLLPLAAFMVLGVAMMYFGLMDEGFFEGIDAALEGAPADATSSQELAYLSSNTDALSDLGLVVAFDIAGIILLAWPLYYFIKIQVAFRSSAQIKRTAQGEVLSEQIAGMKNFIHDFSNLSQAEKEALVVWDEFLIYAVVLEENTAIAKEIAAMRNLPYAVPSINWAQSNVGTPAPVAAPSSPAPVHQAAGDMFPENGQGL